jgi:HAD superfamily hydrolase (TIGR01549 family)
MLQKEGLRAVIFDIDGTLVDSFSVYRKVFDRGIADHNLGPVPEGFLNNCLRKGKGLREILEGVFPPGTDDTIIDACKDRIKRLFRQVESEEINAFPGVEELFEHLKSRGVKIGIATGRVSTPEDEWRRFTRLGLNGFVDAIVTSHDIFSRKPAPDVLLACAMRLDVPIGACLAVGDTESDILAAKRAGAVAVYVRTGEEDADAIAKAGPDIILESTYDLLALLKGE